MIAAKPLTSLNQSNLNILNDERQKTFIEKQSETAEFTASSSAR